MEGVVNCTKYLKSPPLSKRKQNGAKKKTIIWDLSVQGREASRIMTEGLWQGVQTLWSLAVGPASVIWCH